MKSGVKGSYPNGVLQGHRKYNESFLKHDSCAPVERNRCGYSFNPRLHLGLEYIRLSAFWGMFFISFDYDCVHIPSDDE